MPSIWIKWRGQCRGERVDDGDMKPTLNGFAAKCKCARQDFRIYSWARACYAGDMKRIASALLVTSALTLSACGQAGQQWLDPDKTFALFDQPKVKTVNETQEDMAKEAAAGDYGRAAQFYQQLIAAQKGTPEQMLRYKFGMADATRRVGDQQAALAMFEELSRENPTNLDVMEGKGLTLMATGKTVDAGRTFADIMEKDPKRWRTLNALGILFVTKNMVPEAIAYYTEALNNSPDNAAILNNVGLSYAVDRNFSRAIEALQTASRVSKVPSQRKQIELNLALLYGISGDMENARSVASKYIEGPALDNNLGLYAHLAKDDGLAKTYLNMALSQSTVFYERAWENLDVVNDNSRTEGASPPASVKSRSTGSLPKLDALQQPSEPQPDRNRSGKTRKYYKGQKAETPLTPAPAAEIPAAVMTPEITVDKPAGLIVGPSE
jgi:Flp pilus assembly protein TadD